MRSVLDFLRLSKTISIAVGRIILCCIPTSHLIPFNLYMIIEHRGIEGGIKGVLETWH